MLKGVGGGNFLILARTGGYGARGRRSGGGLDGFSAGRHPSISRGRGPEREVKSAPVRIKSMIASTNDAYCPTLRAVTQTALPEE